MSTTVLTTDLRGAEDIRTMVDAFYAKVQKDPLLSPIFNDEAKVDWPHHLPTMYQFWETILFRAGTYQGNPYLKHVPLPVNTDHFERWVGLFTETVDERFAGAKANEAKEFANLVAHTFMGRLGLVKKLF